MSQLPAFNPMRLLERLTARGVDFVVIGGFAAIAHGSPLLTQDLDIVYAPDPGNLDALGNVLVELGARLRGVADDVPFVPDAATRRIQVLTLDTPDGALDVLARPDGSPPYAQLRARAERLDLGGITVAVAGLDDLIAMKQAAGRPKDHVALEHLEAVRRERRRRG
jgi:predicted nucleotidyltransferase